MLMKSTQAMETASFSNYAEQVYARCDALALHSQSYEGMDRRYLTSEHKMANLQVKEWMEQANMLTWTDEAGNQWGRYKSNLPDAPTLIMGSHIDTVPNGGIYDGILGVLLPITLVESLAVDKVSLPFNLDIVAFGDEEGTRYGTTLLGSRAVTGNWQQHWNTLSDSEGVTIKEALEKFGGNLEEISNASRKGEKLLGFVETHIEQGPVLEAEDLPVGVVSGIAGANRYKLKLTGLAGHAGTVPMNMRNDALVAASEMIVAIEDVALETGVVATVGSITNKNNAVNVIPGDVEFTIDIRSEQDVRRDTAVEILRQVLNKIAIRRNVEMEWKMTHSAPAVKCDEQLQYMLCEAVSRAEYRRVTLTSGAGHDAMEMANICSTAILFVRCARGISHHPAESVDTGDIEVALRVLSHFVDIFAQELNAS